MPAMRSFCPRSSKARPILSKRQWPVTSPSSLPMLVMYSKSSVIPMGAQSVHQTRQPSLSHWNELFYAPNQPPVERILHTWIGPSLPNKLSPCMKRQYTDTRIVEILWDGDH